MIIYYDSSTYSITGFSVKHNPTQTDLYIETDQHEAEQIFLGKERVFHYQVEVIDADQHTGSLVRKIQAPPSKSNIQTISDLHYLVPDVSVIAATFTITQITADNRVKINLSEQGHNQWINQYKSAPIPLMACVPNDPYQLLWATILTPQNINDTINYTGRDNLCFYTKKLFESYQHVIT